MAAALFNIDDSPGMAVNVDVTAAEFDCVANNPRNGVDQKVSGRRYGCRAVLSTGGGTLVVRNLDGVTSTTFADPGTTYTFPVQASAILVASTLKTFVVFF